MVSTNNVKLTQTTWWSVGIRGEHFGLQIYIYFVTCICWSIRISKIYYQGVGFRADAFDHHSGFSLCVYSLLLLKAEVSSPDKVSKWRIRITIRLSASRALGRGGGGSFSPFNNHHIAGVCLRNYCPKHLARCRCVNRLNCVFVLGFAKGKFKWISCNWRTQLQAFFLIKWGLWTLLRCQNIWRLCNSWFIGCD